jgi:hypothetical protein
MYFRSRIVSLRKEKKLAIQLYLILKKVSTHLILVLLWPIAAMHSPIVIDKSQNFTHLADSYLIQ